MSTAEEESDTVTVETVNSVTLTQDTEGNLILHCPQNGIELYCIVFFLLFPLVQPSYLAASKFCEVLGFRLLCCS